MTARSFGDAFKTTLRVQYRSLRAAVGPSDWNICDRCTKKDPTMLTGVFRKCRCFKSLSSSENVKETRFQQWLRFWGSCSVHQLFRQYQYHPLDRRTYRRRYRYKHAVSCLTIDQVIAALLHQPLRPCHFLPTRLTIHSLSPS